MSPPGFTIAATRFASTLFRLPSHRGRGLPKLRLLASRFRLEKANREWHPDLIVPLDDFAAWLLRGLATDRSVSAKLRHLLEVSLGSPLGYDAACSRTQFLELATKIGAALWRPWPEAVVDLRSGGSDRLRLGSTCEAIPKSTIIPATPVAIAPPPPQ
jgi:hypothetical protein